MSDDIKPVAKINVTERKLEWLTEPWNVKWETSIVAVYPDIPLYDQATVESLQAKVEEQQGLLMAMEEAKNINEGTLRGTVTKLEAELQSIRSINEGGFREAYEYLGIEDDGEYRWKWLLLELSNVKELRAMLREIVDAWDSYDGGVGVRGVEYAIEKARGMI